MNRTLRTILLASVAVLTCLVMPRRADAQNVVARVDHKDLGALHWQLAAQADTFQAMTCFEMIDQLHARVVHHIELAPGQALSPDRPGVTVGPDMSRTDIDALTAKLASVHMDVVSYGITSFGRSEADARRVFALGKALHVKNIVASAPSAPPLAVLDRLAGEYGINVVFVNGVKPSPGWDPAALSTALQNDSPRLGACVDIAAYCRSGLVPLAAMQQLGSRVLEIRLEDGAGPDEDAVLRTLKTQGFVGIFAVGSQAGTGPARTDAWVTGVNDFSDAVGRTMVSPKP